MRERDGTKKLKIERGRDGPLENVRDIFGISCEYKDGVTEREMWGTKQETELAVCLRSREIVSEINLKRAYPSSYQVLLQKQGKQVDHSCAAI